MNILKKIKMKYIYFVLGFIFYTFFAFSMTYYKGIHSYFLLFLAIYLFVNSYLHYTAFKNKGNSAFSVTETQLNPSKNALEVLFKSSHGIALNANDFFAYASAEIVIIDPLDFEWVFPFVNKYGDTGVDVIMCFIAQRQPIPPRQTGVFKEVYKELQLLNPTVHSAY